jgi:MFS transporter, putative metabolite:H+ symporter
MAAVTQVGSQDTALLGETAVEPKRVESTAALQVGVLFESMPLTFRHLLAGVALFFLVALDAWEMMIIVYTAPLIAADFKLSPGQLGSLIGAMFIGIGLGAFIWGPICDRLGRRRSILLSLVLYGVLSFLSAFSPSFPALYVARMVAGFALAGVMVTTFPLFEELLPVSVRGKFTVYLSVGWPVGMLLALGTTVLFSHWGWRVVLGVSSLAALWSLVIKLWVPESPYWLVGVGRQQEAKTIISRLSSGRVTIPAAQELAVEEGPAGAIFEVFKTDMLRVTLLQVAVNFTFNWGYWGLQTWLPTLLQQRGFSLPQSYGFIATSALCMIPGYVAASYFTGRYGRKWIMFAFVGASALAGFAFGNAPSHLLLYVFNFLLAVFSMGASGIWNTWSAEFYPTRIRVVGYGWGLTAGRVASIAAPSVIGFVIAGSSSFNATVMFINAFLIATAALVLFLPETEGQDLH